ncbi:MAG: ion transporter [Mariprofundaceae bacterium]
MSDSESTYRPLTGLRAQLNSLLFDTSTTQGKILNRIIIVVIMVAVFLSMMDTVANVHNVWAAEFATAQRWIMIGFTIEYVLRVYAAPRRAHYMKGFNGIIDLLTILPLFLGMDGNALIRLLRLFRVVKVALHFPVVRALFLSLQGSMPMLLGVLGTIAMISVLMGNLINILEPETFPNAFDGAWWSLVTMSTVGYGDFVPQTPSGRMVAAALIMAGICMFAMVTAVISVRVGRMANMGTKCVGCNRAISSEFSYCPHCGSEQSDDIQLFDDED